MNKRQTRKGPVAGEMSIRHEGKRKGRGVEEQNKIDKGVAQRKGGS